MSINLRNWLKSIICLSFILILRNQADAQKRSPENTLLWEISGNGLQKPSYLFGTYHFADKGFIDTMKVVNEKLISTDAIVGEIVIDATVAMKLLPFMMMKDSTLNQLLAPADYKLVGDYVKKITGYDIAIFSQMKPMAIQVTILQALAPKTFTAENPAIDEYFQTYGKANKKEVLGLETIEDQGKTLFGNSLKRQAELLLLSVKDADKAAKQTQDLYTYYITQDLEKMAQLMKDTGGYTEAEMNVLLKNRNLNWLSKLPGMMQNKSLFVVVGAAHLVGNDGLVKGLRDKGYQVKPLRTN